MAARSVNSKRPLSSSRLAPLLLSASLLFLSLCTVFWPFISDDTLISVRYAARLLEGQGLTWTDGRPVEGYSNLLWILVISGLGTFGIDLVAASRLTGICSGILILFLISHIHRFLSPIAHAGALFTAAASLPFAVWAIGGLEMPLFCLLLLSAYVAALSTQNQTHLIGVFLAAATLTRADGIICAAAFGVCLFLQRRQAFRPLTPLAYVMAAFVGQVLFRYLYYGDFVPNTAYAKVAFSLDRLAQGAHYTAQGLLYFFPATLGFFGSLMLLIKTRAWHDPRWICVVAVFAWLVHITLVGGDILPAFRFLLPIIVLSTPLVAFVLDSVFPSSRARPLLPVYGLAAAAVYIFIQASHPLIARALYERWEWHGKALATVLKEHFAEQQPLSAISAAGCLGYWTGFPAIDMHGLNDHHIARAPSRTRGSGYLGHDFGDGSYVLSRRPDFVFFCGPPGFANPCTVTGKQMAAQPQFVQLYRLASILYRYENEPHQMLLWVLKDSPRVGIQHSAQRITIPSYLLSSKEFPAESSPQGLTLELPPFGTTAPLTVQIPPGTWEITRIGGQASPPQVAVATNKETLAVGPLPLSLRISEGKAVQAHMVVSNPSSRPLSLSALMLRRTAR